MGLQRYEDFLNLQVFSGKFSKKCRFLQRSLELLQETEVVLEVVAEVTHLPLEHRDTLDSHSECESAVFLAVDA